MLPIRQNRWFRILLVAFLMYTISYADRTNISMAIPSLKHQLGLTSGAIGLATGTFFIAYMVLQIPAGRWAETWSAKKFVFYAILAWGVVSASTAFVQNDTELVINRVLLGIAEGGVLTATVILIRHWFVRKERARANMVFLLSIPLAPAIANPISGLLLQYSGWRMMFILEAIPAFVWATLWFFSITDRPEDAKWFPQKEREQLIAQLENERQAETRFEGHWAKALIHPSVVLFAFYNFFALIGNWGITTWLPSALKAMHVSIVNVGYLSSLIYFVSAASMIFFAYTSDALKERKWHIILLTAGSGVFMLIYVLIGNISLALVVTLLALSTASFFGRFGAFWAWPTEFLPVEVAGVGVALTNGVGNLGGLFGPYIVGAVRTATHSFTMGFVFMSLMFFVAGLLAMFVRNPKQRIITDPALVSSVNSKTRI